MTRLTSVLLAIASVILGTAAFAQEKWENCVLFQHEQEILEAISEGSFVEGSPILQLFETGKVWNELYVRLFHAVLIQGETEQKLNDVFSAINNVDSTISRLDFAPEGEWETFFSERANYEEELAHSWEAFVAARGYVIDAKQGRTLIEAKYSAAIDQVFNIDGFVCGPAYVRAYLAYQGHHDSQFIGMLKALRSRPD